MPVNRLRLSTALLSAAFVLVACTSASPTLSPSVQQSVAPVPSDEATPAAPGSAAPNASVEPSAAPPVAAAFPLAVVTGFTNLKADITLDEVAAAAADGTLIVPCGVTVEGVAAQADPCTAPDQIGAALDGGPGLALLPAGLVDARVKVLPVDGADLFGSAEARTAAYPITGSGELAAEWTAYDPDEIRTLVSVGESCPDRGVAYQAITLGKGWEYVFGGGTAAYQRVYPNPVGSGLVGDGFDIVDAVPTGNEGAVWDFIGAADITVEDFECPVLDAWTVNEGVNFSIDPRVLQFMADGGTDVVTLASNHLTDRGIDGFLETLEHFDEVGIARTGGGADLDEALEPAVVDVNGLRFAVVGWNLVPGAVEAGPGQPGVAWMHEDSIRDSVARAREAGDIVICMPQWGYPEYRVEFTEEERVLQELFFDAGCDHVLGHGTHWASQIDFTADESGAPGFTILSHGNFLFGQSWSQQTQEGVLPELTFRGTDLVQVRLHPYIMLLQAQASFTDPQTDGAYVLNRVYSASDVTY